MILAVINFSGNVGKSTLSRHLLAPRMNDAYVVPIESVCSYESDNDPIRGRQFGELIEELMIMDDAVVDIGASNVEEFMAYMTQYEGSHDVFDYFIIPVTSERKVLENTASTILALSEIGVPADKIKLVINKVSPIDNIERDFASIIDFHNKSKLFELSIGSVVYKNELYERLSLAGKSISEIIADETDYNAAIRRSDDKAEKVRLARAFTNRMLAPSVNENLDEVFIELFKQKQIR